ncbi:MAG TPA: glycosyltransferase family 9 protein [Cytophagaceae bacterium]|jgi:ADP-heptose:LPS heptosyltransferase|nr:glycosyltransferase family 9 protein [Cytophagaceae bacterium]
MTKILILRFSSIGDIVLTTPVVRALKQQIENVEIHYCTKPGFKTLLESNPNISKVHCLSNSLGELIEALKKEKFDFVVDLHNNLRTSIIKFRLGVKSKSFDKLNFKKWLLVNFKLDRLPALHIVERYLEAASELNIKNDGLGLDYFIPAKDKVDLKTLPLEYRNGYVAFAIGAQHFTKRLPVDQIIELCRKISQPILLMGGKEDSTTGEEIAMKLATENRFVFNACGKFNLNQSASLLEQSNLVFSHDTGLMHIAAAFKKEIYSIWGNTVPAFGMYPYKTDFHSLENVNLNCRPCSKIGHDKCPKSHFKCMKEQNFDFIQV